MDLKSLICLFFIVVSISISIADPDFPSSSTFTPSKEVQENRVQGSLIRGNEDGDHESFFSYVKKGSRGAGGGESSSIHHSRRNRASSLSTRSWFVFPCIVVFGLIVFPII